MPAYLKRFAALAAIVMVQLRSLTQVAEPEPVDYPFSASDISQLHRIAHDPAAASVDDQTWSGLLVEPYFAMLAGQLSIFGKQVLHHRLRDGLRDGERSARGDGVRLAQRLPCAAARRQPGAGRECQSIEAGLT